jgi:hypothetical protein
VFDARAIQALRGIFASVCSDAQATLVEMDGEDDHVHLLVEYPPKVAVSSLVNSLKGVSSRLLRQQRPDIRTRLCLFPRWRAHQHRAPIYRATENSGLKIQDGFPHPSALSFLALKDGACRATWSIGVLARAPFDLAQHHPLRCATLW